MVWFQSLSTAARFQSLPHWFRLVIRWQREVALRWSTSRRSKARHQNQFQKKNELSRWPKCDIREAHHLCPRKDAIRCLKPGEPRTGTGRPIVNPQVPSRIREPKNQSRRHTRKIIGCPKENSRVHRLQQDAAGRNIPTPKHRETGCELHRKRTKTYDNCRPGESI